MEPLPSGLPEIIADDESLARFLTGDGQFNAKMAKPGAFLPEQRDRETSVFRVSGQTTESIWAIGETSLEGRKFYGAAIFEARIVRSVKLELVADEPPPRHSVIRKWPWVEDDPELRKAHHKELALTIASQSELRLKR